MQVTAEVEAACAAVLAGEPNVVHDLEVARGVVLAISRLNERLTKLEKAPGAASQPVPAERPGETGALASVTSRE